MLFDEEKIVLAKTFDQKKNDFVPYKYKGDIDVLERFRYLNAQLNLILARISNLIDFLANGQRRLNSKTGLQMLSAMEKQAQVETTRVIFYNASVKEIQKDLGEARKSILSEEMKKDLTSIAEKLKVLEQEVGIPDRLNDKNVLINIIENIENIRRRVKNQEEIIKKAFGISIDIRIDELRKEVTTEYDLPEFPQSEAEGQ